MPFKPRRSTEREMRRRCKQVAREVARITSSGQDATTIVYALEEYGRQVEPWAEDVMLKIVEMSDRQNLGIDSNCTIPAPYLHKHKRRKAP